MNTDDTAPFPPYEHTPRDAKLEAIMNWEPPLPTPNPWQEILFCVCLVLVGYIAGRWMR